MVLGFEEIALCLSSEVVEILGGFHSLHEFFVADLDFFDLDGHVVRVFMKRFLVAEPC